MCVCVCVCVCVREVGSGRANASPCVHCLINPPRANLQPEWQSGTPLKLKESSRQKPAQEMREMKRRWRRWRRGRRRGASAYGWPRNEVEEGEKHKEGEEGEKRK